MKEEIASEVRDRVLPDRTEKGKIPVEEFIETLDVKMQVKVLRTIGLLIEHGTRIGEPYSSRLAKGIFELRVQQANNISRILYEDTPPE